jgi:hypothetical protein
VAIVQTAVAPAASKTMTSQGTPHGRFQRAIHSRHVQNAETAARELGGLSLADALLLRELLANTQPVSEVALAASALAEPRHGHRNVGLEVLKRLLRRG